VSLVSDATTAGDSSEVVELTALLAQLRAQHSADTQRIEKLERDCFEYQKLVRLLQEANEKLKRGLLGQKAERLPTDTRQLSLALLKLALGEEASRETLEQETKQKVAEHERKKPVRKPLPEHLPRVPIEIIPEEVKREGLDAFERIGQERREVLERRPSSTVVVELIYPKYVRKGRDRTEATKVSMAAAVELPIERGVAGPGMLADTIIRRWEDHQPLNHLEAVYAREGLDLAKSTLCNWHEMLGELAAPLVDAMFADAYSAPYLCVDATGVLVQAPERCKNGHFWVLVAPGKHVLYRFSDRHDSAAVDALLEGYKGYLVADAHVVYNHLYADGGIIEVGCWAHTRRYFFASVESDPHRAKHALGVISALFRIERSVAGAPRKKKEAVRNSKSRPIVQQFFEWCTIEQDVVLDESPISKAIGYALNQQAALERFLSDGRLPMENNISELHLRREVVGRKRWLFVGSSDAAGVNTIFVTLLASARLNGIEPLGYLRDLFILLPSWPRHRVLELAPAFWQQTLEQPETQQKLAANVFRRILLDLPA